ncbi:hypothetical protein F5878DRAFT_605493 [Lentinula raphanica]|uniref:Uncharacterized protein n=1 Tax=Lentinula raphanica TaxID=153919 RepID=A0AA38PIG8_9AGAR|nr:hypothetical protein F5878DRAFT_605493 [Lentinula raphanica]
MDVDTVDSVQVILALDESETISQALDRVNRVEILKEVWDADPTDSQEKPVLKTVLERLSNTVVLKRQRNAAILKAVSFNDGLRVSTSFQHLVSNLLSHKYGVQISALFGPESIYQGKDPAKGSIVLFCRLPLSFSVGGDIHGEEDEEVVGREQKTKHAWYKYRIHKEGSADIELELVKNGEKGAGPGTQSVNGSGTLPLVSGKQAVQRS